MDSSARGMAPVAPDLVGAQAMPASASSGHDGLDHPDDGRPGGWWMVAVLTLLYAVSLLDRQVLHLLIVDIRRDLHISDFEVSAITGIGFALFYVTFGLVFGRAADVWPRRWIIFGGVVVWSGCAAACGLARGMGSLALARFGLGAGEAALNPAAYSLISDRFPRKRLGLAMSVFGAGSHLGGVTSMLCGGLVITLLPAAGVVVPVLGHLERWRAVFLLVGLPGILLALLVWTFREPPRRKSMTGGKTTFADGFAYMRRHPRFYLGHFLGFGLLCSVVNGWHTWLPTYLMRHFGLTVAQIVPYMAAVLFISGGLGTIAAGAVADRMVRRGWPTSYLVLTIGMCMITAVGAVCSMLAPTPTLLWLFTAVGLLGTAFSGIASAALQVVTPPEFRGQISASYLFVFNLFGVGVGPVLVGAITTYGYANDAQLGWSIIVHTLIFAPLAVVAMAVARADMARILRARQGGAA